MRPFSNSVSDGLGPIPMKLMWRFLLVQRGTLSSLRSEVRLSHFEASGELMLTLSAPRVQSTG